MAERAERSAEVADRTGLLETSFATCFKRPFVGFERLATHSSPNRLCAHERTGSLWAAAAGRGSERARAPSAATSSRPDDRARHFINAKVNMTSPLSPTGISFPVVAFPTAQPTRSSSPKALARFKQLFRTSADELEELNGARARSSTMPTRGLFAQDFVDQLGGQGREWRRATGGGARSGSSSGGIGTSHFKRFGLSIAGIG